MSKNNPKKIVEVAKKIIKKRDDEIKLLKTELRTAKGEKQVTFKMPDDVHIRNFPTLQKVQIENQPDIQKVHITNPAQPIKILDVKVTNFKDTSEIQKVEIINQKDNEIGKWMPKVITMAIEGMTHFWVKLWGEGLTVRLAQEERMKPLPVVMVDEFGRPVKHDRTGVQAYPVMISSGNKASGVIPAASIITSGRKTSTTIGTAVKLISIATTCRKVIMTALDSNAGVVYVGGSTVLATAGSEKGLMLEPTGSATLEIDDVSKIYIDVLNSGDGVTFTYLS